MVDDDAIVVAADVSPSFYCFNELAMVNFRLPHAVRRSIEETLKGNSYLEEKVSM